VGSGAAAAAAPALRRVVSAHIDVGVIDPVRLVMSRGRDDGGGAVVGAGSFSPTAGGGAGGVSQVETAATAAAATAAATFDAAERRYTIVGAAVCELDDGRCALFAVSAHLTHAELAQLSAPPQPAPGASAAATPPALTSTRSLPAETSVLELPPGSVSVELQVATQSALVRVVERDGGGQPRSGAVLCLALDAAGRPLGAASMRGRALGSFFLGGNGGGAAAGVGASPGVRAFWRIRSDGACSGNIAAGALGLVHDGVLGPGDGASRNPAATDPQQQSGRRAPSGALSARGVVTSQRHAVIACTWVPPTALAAAQGSAVAAATSAPPFACLSVILSEWSEATAEQSRDGAGVDGVTHTDRSACVVLLSQMGGRALDEADSAALGGLVHRKVAVFRRPAEVPALERGSPGSGVYAASAALSPDGSLLLIAVPIASAAAAAAGNATNNSSTETARAAVAVTVVVIASSSSSSFTAASSAPRESAVLTFVVESAYPATALHLATSPQLAFLGEASMGGAAPGWSESRAASAAAAAAAAAAIFLPACGCCAVVSDVLRAPSRVVAAPVVGFGALSSGFLSGLDLRTSDKFPVVPRMARAIAVTVGAPDAASFRRDDDDELGAEDGGHPPDDGAVARHWREWRRVQALQRACRALRPARSETSSSALSVAFAFFGLPASDAAVKSGAAACVVVARVESFARGGQRGSDPVALEWVRRAVTSVQCECAYLAGRFRVVESLLALGGGGGAAADREHATDVAAGGGFAALMADLRADITANALGIVASFMRRLGAVAAASANHFTQGQHSRRRPVDREGTTSNDHDGEDGEDGDDGDALSAFAKVVIALAKACDVLLDAHAAAVTDRTTALPADASTAAAATTTATTLAASRVVAQSVAAAFMGPVGKLLQAGLVSAAARVAHAVGPFCPPIVDAVFPSAALLYKASGTGPSYASFLHDIEPLVSAEGRAVFAALERCRPDARTVRA
jgi:hypothetical protein